MGMHTNLSKQLIRFLEKQSVFFIATAAEDGRINLSPKGLKSLKVISADRLIWMNLTGSGNETAAHLLVNPRITLMACAFEGDPLILRVYGQAKSVQKKDADWAELSAHFEGLEGERQIIDIQIESVQTSCGSGVPLLSFEAERDELNTWAEKLGEEGVKDYWVNKNLDSIDGFDTGMRDQLSKR